MHQSKQPFLPATFSESQKQRINNLLNKRVSVTLETAALWVTHCFFFVCVNVGVISADHEDEAQRPEEASDGEIQGGRRPGLRWGGQVQMLFTSVSLPHR